MSTLHEMKALRKGYCSRMFVIKYIFHTMKRFTTCIFLPCNFFECLPTHQNLNITHVFNSSWPGTTFLIYLPMGYRRNTGICLAYETQLIGNLATQRAPKVEGVSLELIVLHFEYLISLNIGKQKQSIHHSDMFWYFSFNFFSFFFSTTGGPEGVKQSREQEQLITACQCNW